MIASIRGTLLERSPGHCVVEAAGVGYLLQVSTQTAAALPETGREVFLRARQVVREDAVLLFGFAEAEELRLFDLLIGVNGVGPRLALAVLSGLRPAALARAIRDENVAALVAVPGIGRKTAERLVVEMRDRLGDPEAPAAVAGAIALAASASPESEAYGALVALGYRPAEATRLLKAVGPGTHTTEELIRRALQGASRAG